VLGTSQSGKHDACVDGTNAVRSVAAPKAMSGKSSAATAGGGSRSGSSVAAALGYAGTSSARTPTANVIALQPTSLRVTER
jgi:hypothetical protein